MTGASWEWDPSLYAGSAAYYTRGRVAYPQEFARRLADVLGLDGTGRLLDVGCGPGSLTLLLAPLSSRSPASAKGIHAGQCGRPSPDGTGAPFGGL